MSSDSLHTTASFCGYGRLFISDFLAWKISTGVGVNLHFSLSDTAVGRNC